MKSNNNKQPTSLYVELLHYFIIFTIILIALLWIFEILLLNYSYKSTRVNDIVSTTNELLSDINNDSFSKKVRTITIEQSMSAFIINSSTGTIIEANPYLTDSLLSNFNVTILINRVIKSYEENGGLLYVNNSGTELLAYDNTGNINQPYYRNDVKALICVNKTVNINDEVIYVIVIGSILPVNATVSTVKRQLFMITIILLLISSIIALVAAKKISKPITQISNDAKELAKGDYDISFNGKGYTEIEELSLTLSKMAKELGKADQMQKDLIANVSHDLRTPLTMISGYGELIRDIPDENNKENVQVIIDEATRLSSLVNNLLDISKLQSSNVDINLKVINLNELLYQVYNTYNSMMKNKGYSITIDCDNQILYVNADVMRLQQVMYNFVNNAINHCGADKQVIIAAHNVNGKARVEVIDHGEGICEEDIPHIWERYYKAENHGRAEAGTGLGLSIAKTILELHKAKYGVETKPKEGSNFYFELPIVEN